MLTANKMYGKLQKHRIRLRMYDKVYIKYHHNIVDFRNFLDIRVNGFVDSENEVINFETATNTHSKTKNIKKT